VIEAIKKIDASRDNNKELEKFFKNTLNKQPSSAYDPQAELKKK
jgi:hypothetical protein